MRFTRTAPSTGPNLTGALGHFREGIRKLPRSVDYRRTRAAKGRLIRIIRIIADDAYFLASYSTQQPAIFKNKGVTSHSRASGPRLMRCIHSERLIGAIGVRSFPQLQRPGAVSLACSTSLKNTPRWTRFRQATPQTPQTAPKVAH